MMVKPLLRRRVFASCALALVANCASSVFSHVAHAQQTAVPRHVGVLLVGRSPESKDAQQFRHGLLDAGYAEGRDVVIDWRSAEGNFDQITKLATDLVQ